jgi:hypothetical protein
VLDLKRVGQAAGPGVGLEGLANTCHDLVLAVDELVVVILVVRLGGGVPEKPVAI